jgi:isoleucyl-tRNA synthetase
VVLSTELTDALVSEGLARELVHVIQTQRRDMALEYTARIRVGLVTDSPEVQAAATNFADYIQGETLSTELRLEPLPNIAPIETKVGEYTSQFFVAPI